ncbi:hypothetical protein [Salarchaeum sp. JOR-1]|uniref:hypothetical protein n=1 Tax=Salarchaeum sp. JOR-1 TaxID=2599399 RepID=UPI00119830A3|nr:hypothetical protein [Salarchaeum sp. JOR-1]QDX40985.1 hypothetical protein FQU85_08765 [Salarchaeum sp. JOR-1]
MTSRDVSSLVSFSLDADTGELTISDDLAGLSFSVTLADPGTLTAAPQSLLFPVDDAVALTTDELVIPPDANARLRDETGEYRGEFSTTPREIPEGTHYIELGRIVKTYVVLPRTSATAGYDAPHADGGSLRVSFPERTRVVVGARSRHNRPHATITVPDDPRALMSAVGALGASVKEWSAERSWPTLRGHPPAIERGDELAIPDGLSVPDTGVTITVPETYADVYRIAPLAFYLGATVEPGEPAIRLDNGYTHALSRPLEPAVDRALARCLLLDTLVRTNGYYSFPRYEYDEIAAALPFYPPKLYDRPIPDQLLEYFEVSWETLAPVVPRWPATAVLAPSIEDAPLLPHALNGLWRVRIDDSAPTPSPTIATMATRGSPDADTGRLVREAFDPERVESRATPDTATVAVATDDPDRAAAFRNRLDTTALDPDNVTVGRPGASVPTAVDLYYDDTRDGTATPARGDEPTVAVTTGDAAGDTALELVRARSVAALALPDRPATDVATGTLELLADGHPPASVADYGEVNDAVVVGRPNYTPVVQPAGYVPAVGLVDSQSTTEHILRYRVNPSDDRPLGGSTRNTDDFSAEVYRLTGVDFREPGVYSTDEIVDVANRDHHACWINSQLVYPSETVTASMVRKSARNALQDSA